MRQTDCGVELNDGFVVCDEADAEEVKIETTQNGGYTHTQCGISSQTCVTKSVVNTNVKITSSEFLNNPLKEQKTSTGPVISNSAQPFAVAGDLLLTIQTDTNTNTDHVVVTRSYDRGGGVFGIGEQLTLVRNQRQVPVVDCDFGNSACELWIWVPLCVRKATSGILAIRFQQSTRDGPFTGQSIQS